MFHIIIPILLAISYYSIGFFVAGIVRHIEEEEFRERYKPEDYYFPSGVIFLFWPAVVLGGAILITAKTIFSLGKKFGIIINNLYKRIELMDKPSNE